MCARNMRCLATLRRTPRPPPARRRRGVAKHRRCRVREFRKCSMFLGGLRISCPHMAAISGQGGSGTYTGPLQFHIPDQKKDLRGNGPADTRDPDSRAKSARSLMLGSQGEPESSKNVPGMLWAHSRPVVHAKMITPSLEHSQTSVFCLDLAKTDEILELAAKIVQIMRLRRSKFTNFAPIGLNCDRLT
jgi:hypothetical protein